jgi:hypothetical protein
VLNRKTTFVIGAGASWDFDFPLGDGLRNRIIELLAIDDPNTSINFSDPGLGELMRQRSTREAGVNQWTDRMGVYRRAASMIRDGLPFARSIDSFLDGLRDEPEVVFLGKLAIATTILRSEAASPLVSKQIQAANAAQTRADRLAKLVGGWHAQLGQILYEGHSRDTVDTIFDHASFIVFNYDRCIEEFLTTSLMRRFAIGRARALGAVARCTIVHPYGQVGAYFPEKEDYVAFGVCEKEALEVVANGIKTFTESMEDRIGDKVKDCVAEAETIVFLGFGWLPQNLELLHATNRVTNASKVFATVLGMPPGEIAVVADQLDRMLRRLGHSADYAEEPTPSADFIYDRGDCKALMSNCWLRLTRA